MHCGILCSIGCISTTSCITDTKYLTQIAVENRQVIMNATINKIGKMTKLNYEIGPLMAATDYSIIIRQIVGQGVGVWSDNSMLQIRTKPTGEYKLQIWQKWFNLVRSGLILLKTRPTLIPNGSGVP